MELKHKLLIALIVFGVLFGTVVSWLFAFSRPPTATGLRVTARPARGCAAQAND